MNDPLAIPNWHWEVTRNCNLQCAHCIVGDKKPGSMSTSSALEVLDKIALLGGKRLYLTGGEPLIRNDLGKLTVYAKTIGLSTCIITNGTVKERLIELMRGDLLDGVGISIDGDEPVHDAIRGRGSYRKTVDTLKMLLAFDVPVTVYLTVNSRNIGQLGQVVAELIRLGVRSLHLNEINREGRAANTDLAIDHLALKRKIEVVLAQLNPYIELTNCFADDSCGISSDTAYVDCEGLVYACAELALAGPHNAVGRLLDDGFEESYRLYYDAIRIPKVCRYSVYNYDGLGIYLNNSSVCPILKGGRNGQAPTTAL